MKKNHKISAICTEKDKYCTKTQKKCPKVRKNASREAKNGTASVKSVTLGALLATWGLPVRIFMHFYKGFVNNCAFLLKIHEKTTKIQQIAVQMINTAQKLRKGAAKCAKMHQGRPKMAQPASKVCPDGPKWAHLKPFLHTFDALLATWGLPLRIFTHF